MQVQSPQQSAVDSWQYRAVAFTKAHTTYLGCVLLALLKLGRDKLPAMSTKAIITGDGVILSRAIGKQGSIFWWNHGPVDQLRSQFNQLADALKFTDQERKELFECFRLWIVKDARVKSKLEG